MDFHELRFTYIVIDCKGWIGHKNFPLRLLLEREKPAFPPNTQLAYEDPYADGFGPTYLSIYLFQKNL